MNVSWRVITLPNFSKGNNLATATQKGHIKKTPVEQFERVRSTGIRAITVAEDDALAWVAVSTGADDIVLATALGKIARFHEDEVRAMGRDAAGVIGIRLARKGDQVVGMGVVQPGSDILVLTETGRGKRVAMSDFRVKHRTGQGVGLIPLEGAKTGSVAAVELVTEDDEELLLISSSGQVVRTDVKSVSRQSPYARGVIVMRLHEGDAVAGIAVFRQGLAEQRAIDDNDEPEPDGGLYPGAREPRDDVPAGRARAVNAFGVDIPPRVGETLDLYTGNANATLARKIGRYLDVSLGRCEVFEFANENIFVKILDNVREHDAYLVQPTCSPVQKSIMELLIMIDAFKRASAGRITAVVPYYAYGRSDKKDQPRVPITARLIADMISVAGADRLLTMDLHQGQIQGFFNIPVDELTAVHLLSNYFIKKQLKGTVVVTDLGFAKRARTFAELLDAPLAIVEKRRQDNDDRAEVLNVIGEVKGKIAIVVDDEIDTAGTLMEVDPRAWSVRALPRCTPAPPTECCPIPRSSASATPTLPRSSSPTPSPCRRTSSCARSNSSR